MRPVRLLPLLLLVGLAVVPACAPKRACVPDDAALSRHQLDLNLPPDAHSPVGPGTIRQVAGEFRRAGAAGQPPGGRPYHFLALSGGGLYGGFGAGVLIGWNEAGTRPQFDVVTGISTGSLIATAAFLGQEYDYLLRPYVEGVDRSDILRRRPLVLVPFADAAFSSAPLARKIDEALTPEVFCAVARAHAAGRRLYIGTTNLDTRRLVLWDMGAIAARGTPEALHLYKQVVLASCSIPGSFSPVRIPVEIDGRRYQELHADGGANDGVVFRSFMVADLNRAAGRSGAWAPTGSTLYVVINGKLYADPKCIRAHVLPAVESSLWALLFGKTRDELYRIYLNCLETGVEFRLTAIPQHNPVGTVGSLTLSREDQKRLVAAGAEVGRAAPSGEGWRDLPPGTDPTEQVTPRAGTRFVTGERPPPVRP